MTVFDAISKRVSCRAYRPDPIPQGDLERVIEAARLAPSACNKQPWRFAVARDAELRRRIVTEAFLPGIRMDWALDAPAHVVIGMERALMTHRIAAVISGVDYPWVDIGIAGEHLVLAATELGIGSCWIGWVRPRPLAGIAGWPRSVKAVAVITLGYPREPEGAAPPALRRKAMGEVVRWLSGEGTTGTS